MAITTTRYQSPALGRFVTFTAILPFEDFGHYMHPNPHPFAMEKPLRTLYLLHGITGDDRDWIYGTQIVQYAVVRRQEVIRNSRYHDPRQKIRQI